MLDKEDLIRQALDYHENPRPGKLAIELTKPTDTQNDLALAYSPGVAEPVIAIADNPDHAYRYTGKGNLVGVITNGSAILGLGNRGALAAKPVMEGKAVLFKRFADIDVFDIEIDSNNVGEFVETVARIAPTFGGINLEDIKAPECFEIEYALRQRLDIPVFHDDQHGTAVVVAAAMLNGLELKNKKIEDVEVVIMGAGAAGLATAKLLIHLGVRKQKLWMVDSRGVIHTERHGLGPYKFAFARQTDKRTLDDVMVGADVFIGVSGPDTVKAGHVQKMAKDPMIFALSNPDPEIRPELVKSVRTDALIATGRSDYPNQVNNVLCFPYIFRGALDARSRRITTSMCVAAVESIRQLVKEPVPQSVLDSYAGVDQLVFGEDYLLPKPLDPRLRERVSDAVRQAAVDSHVAAE